MFFIFQVLLIFVNSGKTNSIFVNEVIEKISTEKFSCILCNDFYWASSKQTNFQITKL